MQNNMIPSDCVFDFDADLNLFFKFSRLGSL